MRVGAFAVAVLLFCAINALCWASGFGCSRAADFPYLSWTGWRIKNFLQFPGSPDIVLLGSSLMLVPVAGVEADFMGEKLDGADHHRSRYFEHALQERSQRSARTFDFSLPGEMPSDAYLITDFLLKGVKCPKVIVYGLGPRDFMDNLLPSPAATDPFRNLARFGDVSPISARAMPDWFDRINFELGKLFYLYGRKSDVAKRVDALAVRSVAQLVPVPADVAPLSIDARRSLMPFYLPEQLCRGEAFFRPTTAKERTQFFDNLWEYRNRYRRVKWDTFVGQLEFLADTLELARSRGVHVVLVAMPITDLNRSLIQDYAFNAYMRSIRTIARAKDASFVNLYRSTAFSRSDFGDTVHLHSGGGKKLLDLISAELCMDKECRLALGLPDRDDRQKAGGMFASRPDGEPAAAVQDRPL